MNTSRKIKGIKTRLKEAKEDQGLLHQRLSNAHAAYTEKTKEVNKLKNQLSAIQKSKAGKIKVTEHAILRYLERVEELDIAAVEQQIVTPELIEMTATLGGSGKYPINGFLVVMKKGVVVTIETIKK